MLPRKAIAVAREITQPLHFDRRGVACGEPPGGQELRDVEGVLSVGLDAPASKRAGLCGIGQHQLLNQGVKHLPEPAVESYALNGYHMRPWQGCEILCNLPPVSTSNLLKRYFPTAAAEHARGERVFVQIHADAPAMIERHHKFLHVRGRKIRATTEKHNRSSRPLHGFTLRTLLIATAIVAVGLGLIVWAVRG